MDHYPYLLHTLDLLGVWPIPSGIRPIIETMFNKNFYSGAPVIGIYEMRRINELQYRPSTRKIARELATYAPNLYNFT